MYKYTIGYIENNKILEVSPPFQPGIFTFEAV